MMKNKQKDSQGHVPRPHQPMTNKEHVSQSNDERIDQDFPGYPHHPAKDSTINRRTGKDRKTADAERHNGSAHAFEGTEKPMEDDDFLSDGKE